MSTNTESRRADHTRTLPTGNAGTNCGAAKTLCLHEAEIALLQMKQYAAVVVWRSLLREARRKQSWSICRTVSEIGQETCLSRNTIYKAQKELVRLGYAAILSGGRASRQTITFSLTPITGVVLTPP